MSTVESCCLREAISYHRLAGRSIFNFKGNRSCIRLETFYNRTYKESYYILYEKNQIRHSISIKRISRSVIEHHTIPIFIHLNALEEKYLPDNFDVSIYCSLFMTYLLFYSYIDIHSYCTRPIASLCH